MIQGKGCRTENICKSPRSIVAKYQKPYSPKEEFLQEWINKGNNGKIRNRISLIIDFKAYPGAKKASTKAIIPHASVIIKTTLMQLFLRVIPTTPDIPPIMITSYFILHTIKLYLAFFITSSITACHVYLKNLFIGYIYVEKRVMFLNTTL